MYILYYNHIPHSDMFLPECFKCHARVFATFGGIVLDGLLEGRDVAERAEEQHHLLLLVSNGSDLHKKPNGRPWKRGRSHTVWRRGPDRFHLRWTQMSSALRGKGFLIQLA